MLRRVGCEVATGNWKVYCAFVFSSRTHIFVMFLKMKTVLSFEISVAIYQSARCKVTDELNLQHHCFKKLKSGIELNL